MRRFSKRIITYPLLIVAGVVILVEEALWRLSGLIALLGKLPLFYALEDWILRASPAGALALFGIPFVCLVPIKFLALYWIAGGHPILGIGTILTAKVAGTAVVARLFQLTQPQLLTITWFRWTYHHFMHLRASGGASATEIADGSDAAGMRSDSKPGLSSLTDRAVKVFPSSNEPFALFSLYPSGRYSSSNGSPSR